MSTPGLWAAVNHDVEGERKLGDSGLRFWNVLAANGRYRGDVCSVHAAEHIGGITIAERNANARLIAASPALYDALETALNFIENTESEMGITLGSGEVARAALALARGEAA